MPHIRKSHVSTDTAFEYAEFLRRNDTHSHHYSDLRPNECTICAAADIMERLATERDDLQASLIQIHSPVINIGE